MPKNTAPRSTPFLSSAATTAAAPGGAAASTGTHSILGIVVFLAGAALIGYVFLAANTLFHAPPPQVPAVAPAAADGSGATTGAAALALGRSFTDLLQKLLILLVMCVAGSVLASKGVQLIFAAHNAGHNARHPGGDASGSNTPSSPAPLTAPQGNGFTAPTPPVSAPSPAATAAPQDESPTLIPKSPPRQQS